MMNVVAKSVKADLCANPATRQVVYPRRVIVAARAFAGRCREHGNGWRAAICHSQPVVAITIHRFYYCAQFTYQTPHLSRQRPFTRP